MPQTARRPYRAADAAADLFAASLSEVLRIYFLRENRDLEWSRLRVALQAAGITAGHDNHWGSLAASLKESGVIELVGRRQALVASRNSAKNGAYRLSPLYYEMAQRMAEKRAWGSPRTAGAGTAQQTVLIG